MKIKNIKIKNFKRFTDLSITGLQESTKLVVLVGPNGCGKTSLFDAFNHWYKYKGHSSLGDKDYSQKDKNDTNQLWYNDMVDIDFYDFNFDISHRDNVYGKFYFRTAHRNEPDFIVRNFTKLDDPTRKIMRNTLMENDVCVSENYQRLVSSTISSVYNSDNDGKTVEQLRDELFGKLTDSVNRVFNDLQLESIGNPLENGSFYFTKGKIKGFHYKNLSAGEKSAFDILLDLIIKASYYNNSVFCIDEPEAHMHTSLQAKLLEEIYNLIPDNSQIWIATHSIGMLKKAKEIEQSNENTVAFLDLSDKDFDNSIILTPNKVNNALWNRFIELAFGDFSKLVAPETIVFCEGAVKGTTNKTFDQVVYSIIFKDKYPTTTFISIGSCSEIENPDNVSLKIIGQLLKNSRVIKLVDRDDKSDPEIIECNKNNIRVLNRRHIESYLLDDEIISKLCEKFGQSDKTGECLEEKATAIWKSVNRGNMDDDIKSASGDIYNAIKRILQLKACGNNAHNFLRDTIAPLITEDTTVFKELDNVIFGSN